MVTSRKKPKKAASPRARFNGLFSVCVVLTATLTVSCWRPITPVEADCDVGIWTGTGSFAPSVRATFEAVRVSGFTFDTLTTAELVGNDASEKTIYRYKAIIFPGGDQREYSEYLGSAGRAIIREYVADGGGYIGFGAGGGLAGADSLSWPGIGIIGASTDYPVVQIATPPAHTLTDVSRGENSGPIHGDNGYRSTYNGGPQFFPYTNYQLWTTYRYNVTGTASAMTGEYHAGRVFVTGFQPELEEGLMRDSTSFADEFPDPETEWDLIRRAIAYCTSR